MDLYFYKGAFLLIASMLFAAACAHTLKYQWQFLERFKDFRENILNPDADTKMNYFCLSSYVTFFIQ